MIRQSTIEFLKEMRFGGMASELERQQKDTEADRDMPFDDRLAMYVSGCGMEPQTDEQVYPLSAKCAICHSDCNSGRNRISCRPETEQKADASVCILPVY